jgi:hypothetical protein
VVVVGQHVMDLDRVGPPDRLLLEGRQGCVAALVVSGEQFSARVCQTTSSANTSARAFMSPLVKAAYVRLNTSICGWSVTMAPSIGADGEAGTRRPMTLTPARRPTVEGHTPGSHAQPVTTEVGGVLLASWTRIS